MLSIPFIYGFVCKRWLKGIYVMIKEKRVKNIHTLRLLELLEAYFNSALNKIFAKDLMLTAEKIFSLAEEQWGLRKNRSSTDAAMLKLLTFKRARIKKSTIGEASYDAKVCFDMIHFSQLNIYAAR